MSSKTLYLQTVGEYFHVYNRGINKGTIFFDDRNYEFFIRRMEEYCPSGIRMIAYCLMPNHFHIVLRQDAPGATSLYVAKVCKSYAQAINKQLERTGHLFEGKYRFKHVDDTAYLVHLSQYVHINPVTAKLVKSPEDWNYSSYKDYCGVDKSGIVDPAVVMQEFRDRKNYIEYVREYKTSDREKIKKYLFEE